VFYDHLWNKTVAVGPENGHILQSTSLLAAMCISQSVDLPKSCGTELQVLSQSAA